MLYKYLPKMYAEELIASGVLLFRPLAFFQIKDKNRVRCDEDEGAYSHRPADGAKLFIGGYQVNPIAGSLKVGWGIPKNLSLLLYSLSMAKSRALFDEFLKDDRSFQESEYCCVEIKEPEEFLSFVRNKIEDENLKLAADRVHYYDPYDSSILDNSPPNDLWFCKTNAYRHQQEYRLVVPFKRSAMNAVASLETTNNLEWFLNPIAIKTKLGPLPSDLIQIYYAKDL